MNRSKYKCVGLGWVFCLIVLFACQSGENQKDTPDADTSSGVQRIAIPDSVTQFLVASAVSDFKSHQPPSVIDVRNVKAGYFLSGSDPIFLICGEYLSKEKNEWEGFTTIKTSGYEQYLGSTTYCQDAIFVEPANFDLAGEIRKKLKE